MFADSSFYWTICSYLGLLISLLLFCIAFIAMFVSFLASMNAILGIAVK